MMEMFNKTERRFEWYRGSVKVDDFLLFTLFFTNPFEKPQKFWKSLPVGLYLHIAAVYTWGGG